MSETTTTTTTPAAAPAKKPKRPKSKSMIMASEQLKKAFSDTQEAKARGEMIGWATSLFPQEIPEALGLCIVYPENHSAGLAAQKATAPFLDYAEGVLGCNNDLCSYAKINLAYAELLECPGNNMPVPDFLLVANNGCAETTKWFELLSRKWNIPLFMIDLTYNHFEGVNEARCKYIAAQLRKLIDDLCKLTGKTWDEDKFIEVQKISARNRELWDAVCDSYADVPAPLGGFDLFNYMGSMVFTRGKKETADVFEQLLLEIDEHRKNGTSTFGKKEEFRIFWEGIACFPYLSHNAKTLAKYGINVVSASYGKAWALDYEIGNLEDMARAYCFASSNNILIDETVKRRIEWSEKYHIDGNLYHVNRACKVLSCQQQEVMRRVAEATGKPYISFDGDQADFRNYSEAQFETRIEAFVELMRKNKEGK